MRWLWGVCLSLAFICQVTGKPASTHLQEPDLTEVEYLTELFNRLLIPAQREAREMMDAEASEDDMKDAEEDAEKIDSEKIVADALEDSEAVREAKVMEVARFNNYIDAIYRRMNAALKAKLMDPMELNLDEKVKDKEEKSVKQRVLREAPDEDEESDTEFESRMGKPAKKGGNKKDKKNGKDKKTKEERQAERQKKKDMKKKNKEEKENEKEEDKKMSAKEKKKSNKKNKNSKRESRSNQKNKNKKNKNNENKNKNKSAGGNKRKGQKNIKKGRADKDNVKGKGSKNKKTRKGNDDKNERMVGSLSGIATMMRDGDVNVVDEENHKVVTSAFSVGPLQLQVSKIYGKGKARSVKTAKAITDVMSGTLVLKVKADGTAHVKKVVFKKPENVEVKGKLSDNNPRSLNYLRNSVNKMRPLAAMKILKTARYVLKSPASKQ